MRRIRAGIAALLTGLFVAAGSATALAAQASPDAGGAQPIGGTTWSDGLLKFFIVGVPVIVTAVMWVTLKRIKPRTGK